MLIVHFFVASKVARYRAFKVLYHLEIRFSLTVELTVNQNSDFQLHWSCKNNDIRWKLENRHCCIPNYHIPAFHRIRVTLRSIFQCTSRASLAFSSSEAYGKSPSEAGLSDSLSGFFALFLFWCTIHQCFLFEECSLAIFFNRWLLSQINEDNSLYTWVFISRWTDSSLELYVSDSDWLPLFLFWFQLCFCSQLSLCVLNNGFHL